MQNAAGVFLIVLLIMGSLAIISLYIVVKFFKWLLNSTESGTSAEENSTRTSNTDRTATPGIGQSIRSKESKSESDTEKQSSDADTTADTSAGQETLNLNTESIAATADSSVMTTGEDVGNEEVDPGNGEPITAEERTSPSSVSDTEPSGKSTDETDNTSGDADEEIKATNKPPTASSSTDPDSDPERRFESESANIEQNSLVEKSDEQTAATEPEMEISTEELLERLSEPPFMVDDVHALTQNVSQSTMTPQIVETLEACAKADDPDVRLAVCSACSDLEAGDVEGILKQLRLDNNDQVATAAVKAIR